MANPTDTEAMNTQTGVKAGDETHMRDLPRPGKNKPAGKGATTAIEPVDLETPKTGPSPRRPLTDGVMPPTGIAHLSGLTLRFPFNTKIVPGEVVVVGHKPFEVRKERVLTPMWIVKGVGLLVLSVLAIVGIASMVSGPTGGSVTGVVVDRLTGRVISNATVTLDGGQTVTTNAAGLFMVNGLQSGMFKLTAIAPGYEPQAGSVVRTGSNDAQLAFALMPLALAGSSVQSGVATAPATEAAEENADADAGAMAYGNISLETDFNDYLVFVDGVLYGKDAKKIKRMPAGEHRVVIQLDGFEDFSKNVAVKARNTHTLQVAKSDLVPRVDPIKRAKAHFAEAKEMLDRGLYASAIEKYSLGLKDDPENASAYQYRGWCQFKAGNADGARADLLKAANMHADANRFLDAVACAGHLIEMAPEDPDGYLRRARYFTQMREHDKAIKDCEIAVKLDKKAEKTRLALAEACFVAGDYKRAAKEYDAARKLSDQPADAYVQMLISLARGGEDDQVRKKYKGFTEVATPEMQKKLRDNPDWLRVLQIVDPTKRSEG